MAVARAGGGQRFGYLGPDAEQLDALPTDLRVPDRFSRLAIRAAATAIANAFDSIPPDRLSCILTTSFNTRFSVESWIRSLAERVNPLLFPSATSAVTIGHVARLFGIRGSVTVLNGSNPLPLALSWIESGRESAVLLIAVEELKGIAPSVLAERVPQGLREAACAVVLAAQEGGQPRYPIVRTAVRTGALTEDVAGGGDFEQALRESTQRLEHVLADRLSKNWALCSAGATGVAAPGEPAGWSNMIQPRHDLGDTLGARSLTALCAAIEAGPPPWLINDVDTNGTVTSAWLEAP